MFQCCRWTNTSVANWTNGFEPVNDRSNPLNLKWKYHPICHTYDTCIVSYDVKSILEDIVLQYGSLIHIENPKYCSVQYVSHKVQFRQLWQTTNSFCHFHHCLPLFSCWSLTLQLLLNCYLLKVRYPLAFLLFHWVDNGISFVVVITFQNNL